MNVEEYAKIKGQRRLYHYQVEEIRRRAVSSLCTYGVPGRVYIDAILLKKLCETVYYKRPRRRRINVKK